MSSKKLMVLAIVAALMVVWAVGQSYVSKLKGPVRAPLRGSYLIQGLDPAQIATIVIGRGDNATRLVRQGKRFVVGNKDNYPAVTSKINNLVTGCLDIGVVDLVTSDPANHESLDVTEEKAQKVVKFLDKAGQIITGIVVGTSRLPELQIDQRSTHVRLISSNDVYEAKKVPFLDGAATDYVEKEVVDVDRSEVVKVTVSGPEGSYTLKVDDTNEGEIVLADIPAGKKIKKYDCEQVQGALSNLSFSDVVKESSFGEGKLIFDRTYVAGLKDTTVYTFEAAKAGDKTYVKCSAEYAGATRAIVESDENLEDKEAKLLARDGAVGFTRRHKGWLYEIAEYKAKNLTRELSELVEEEKTDEEPESVDESSSAARPGEEAKSEPPE
jgi:hypothetical protein